MKEGIIKCMRNHWGYFFVLIKLPLHLFSFLFCLSDIYSPDNRRNLCLPPHQISSVVYFTYGAFLSLYSVIEMSLLYSCSFVVPWILPTCIWTFVIVEGCNWLWTLVCSISHSFLSLLTCCLKTLVSCFILFSWLLYFKAASYYLGHILVLNRSVYLLFYKRNRLFIL